MENPPCAHAGHAFSYFIVSWAVDMLIRILQRRKPKLRPAQGYRAAKKQVSGHGMVWPTPSLGSFLEPQEFLPIPLGTRSRPPPF